MKTAVRPGDLQVLEQWLSQELQTEAFQPTPLQIRCAIKQETLLVLVQHSTETAPDVEQMFDRLQHIVLSLNPDFIERLSPAPGALPVRLYMRLVGHKQPYSVRELTLKPAALSFVEPWVEPPNVNEAIAGETVNKGALDERDRVFAKPELATEAEPKEQVSDGVERAIALVETAPNVKPGVTAPVGTKASSSFISWLADVPGLNHIPVSALVFSSIAGVLAVAGGVYVLTRPCVIGECAPIKEAQQISQQSAQLAQPTATPQDVVQAYQQLVEANYLLGTIPPWSAQYETAQTLIQTYEARAEVFGNVVSALQQAQSAAEMSQNPPHPLATWREIQQVWQGAIALLEVIPTDSPIYLLAQQKLEEYQKNLSGINQRIVVEQRAQEQVSAARTAAGVAETREAAAKSVDGWQAVQATWQAVVDALHKVPQGTMAYAEAEQLLAIYQPKWAASRDRYTQEKLSADAYTQALTLAEQARQSEQRRQWSQAVDQWRDALSNAEQVPDGTSYHEQIQPLISSYQTALTTAQGNLRTAVVVQDAEAQLAQACTGTTTICNYSIGTSEIQVRLTRDYDWAVQAVVGNAQLAGDVNTQQALRNYVDSLLRTLAEASQKAQLPLDIYNSQGKVFTTYDPQVGGYMQR